MNIDYSGYELSRRERLRFEAAGFLAIASLVYLFYRFLPLSLLAGLGIRRFLPLYKDYLASRRRQELELQFQDLLVSLSASVAAGRQMEEALIEACENLASLHAPETPVMKELHYMRKCILDNHETAPALLTDLARRSASEDIRSFVQVYLTCRGTGGSLEVIISHTSEIISEKMQIKGQIRAIMAQKKLEGRLISCMPAVMLLALNLLSPAYISVLYSCLAGRLVMTLSLMGSLAGLWLMERMSHVEV